MAACDEWIPLPERDQDKPFLMPVEDVFSITGRGTVATGRIETGVINTGDPVDIIGMGAEKLKSVVTGVEMFRKILDRVKLVTTQVCCSVVSTKMLSAEVWLLPLQVQLLLTPTSKQRFISSKKKKVDVIHLSTTNIVHSSISEQLTLPERLCFQKALKWLCQETTLLSQFSSSLTSL